MTPGLQHVVLSCLLACPTFAPPAAAATPAGTRIINTAAMTSGAANARVTQTSNQAVLTVDEILDVTVTGPSAPVPVTSTKQIVVPFVVTNQGNGTEKYGFTATLSGSGGTIAGIAIDTDGNGAYDASIDTAIDATGISTAPAQQRRVFVLVDLGAALAADLTVAGTATAATGSGAPGTLFAAKGDTGSDAIVGKTGASAQAQAILHPGAATPTLVKSQTVVAPDGSARVMPGSTVTYTLEARFPAADLAVVVEDPIPVGTTFASGSLTLDDQPLSDASDMDAGTFDGSAIRVVLGDVAAAAVHTITFKTIIQ